MATTTTTMSVTASLSARLLLLLLLLWLSSTVVVTTMASDAVHRQSASNLLPEQSALIADLYWDDEEAQFSCDTGVINVYFAYYFGFATDTCGATVTGKIKRLCQGKTSCAIPVTPSYFNFDPCRNNDKILIYFYDCMPESPVYVAPLTKQQQQQQMPPPPPSSPSDVDVVVPDPSATLPGPNIVWPDTPTAWPTYYSFLRK